MSKVAIVLPERLKRRLEEEAAKQEKAIEEVLIDALSKVYSIDSEIKVELHSKLCEKYLKEAMDFLEKRDYVQASGKAWGAASQIIKAVAMKENRELHSHRELWEFASNLSERLQDLELSLLWRSANTLHQNFYENWMPAREVELAINDVKKLLEKMRKLL